jgi:hypothetical protein
MILTQARSAPLNISCGGIIPPADIYNNLSAWFNAWPQNLVISAAGLISQANDISGNGHNATQATVAYQPLWKNAFCNGYPVIRFRGGKTASNATSLASGSYTIGPPINYFMAGRALAWENDGIIVGTGSTGAADNLWSYTGDTYFYIGTVSSGVPVQNIATPIIIHACLNGASSFVICNTTRGKFFSYSPIGTGGFRLGGRNTNDYGTSFNLAELLIYGGNMDEAQQFRIRKYLGNKYNVDVV